ncbi:MAG: hypothetical protein ISS87_02270 [Candidatus Pacebacteria bacterium]|nr:hypothetical protein [Candidatus Paceibacterota bacterium]
MDISLRQQNLLEKIVQEYINTAQPVSSGFLQDKYDFEICPATIRNEMQALTWAGYIFQSHTSAGRMPTDKGYRFFVDNFLEKDAYDFLSLDNIEKIFNKKEQDIFKLSKQLASFLAEACSGLAILFVLQDDMMFEQGWAQVLKEPEFENKEFTLNFIEFLQDFEKDIKDLKINSKTKVYIGKENPIEKAQDLSIILSMYHLPDKGKQKQDGIISIIGPKRMPYQKNISLINSIIRFLE